jgi:thioredoxin reductase/NAD-dependent dihydropyrimidine dehydrogenase PreA subunit
MVPAVLGGVALAVMAIMSMLATRRVKARAAQPFVHAGRILLHSINDDRCIGCDACVAVCPTNVLDLIGNKSRVVRFEDCIQCEQCMWACPTTALVMHPEGTEPPPLTVPELDQNYQTAVPGQYLIGEVAGKPLVKNAANLGRGVVEHMLATGLEPTSGARRAEGSDAKNVTEVDVVIVGSGPGGLSTALTCVQRGLSYVVLEKEQLLASTISRYPKGKLVMAEPYDCRNLSLLPVMDSSKEQIVPLWQELVNRVGMTIRLGEAVESISKTGDGWFDVRTNIGRSYRGQRVVLATGLRGKPRTLGVPGEELPKIHNLLEDPDDWRGKHALVTGGGDSALEAAMALADAGAQVIVSYRGRSFNRAAQKNKEAIQSYAAQRKLKIKFQTQITEFTPDAVTLSFPDGTSKRYPNQVAFVLIGADPPVKFLERLGVRFVQRPHTYQLGPTDAFVASFVADANECPEDVATAAAQVLGQELSHHTAARAERRPKLVESGRKVMRSASEMFASRRHVGGPMPLSEFARRSASRRHDGDGRRDELPPEERTRILRMLRDDGARLADEESGAYGVEPTGFGEHGPDRRTPEPAAVARPVYTSADFEQARAPRAIPPAPLTLPPDDPVLRTLDTGSRARPRLPDEPVSARSAAASQPHPLSSSSPPAPPRLRHRADGSSRPVAAGSRRHAPIARGLTQVLAEVAAIDMLDHDGPIDSAPARRRGDLEPFEEPTRAVDYDPSELMRAAEAHEVGSSLASLAGPPLTLDEPPIALGLGDERSAYARSRDPRRRFRGHGPARSLSDVDWDFED